MNLTDSCRITSFPASVRQAALRENMTFRLSLKAFITSPGCRFAKCVRIHLKILTNPTLPLSTVLVRTREVYRAADIGIEVASRESLTGIPNFTKLNTNLNVGMCQGSPTADQIELFQNRNNVGTNEICVYFVQSIGPTFDGCAISPADQPGAVLDQVTSIWAFAHEVGHVLGLSHIGGEDCSKAAGSSGGPSTTRLMTQCFLGNIIGTPVVVQTEIDTIRKSARALQC